MGVDCSFGLWLNVGIWNRDLHFFALDFGVWIAVFIWLCLGTATTMTSASECGIIDVQDD